MHKARQLYQTATRLARSRRYDPERVIALLNEAIDLGSVEATYALATWYLFGKHVKKNRRKAVELLKRAAAANLPDALYDLALSYETGSGTDKNLKMAFETYLRAALFGDEQSGYEVYRCYFHGIGVRRDRRIANIWADRFEAVEKAKRPRSRKTQVMEQARRRRSVPRGGRQKAV